MTVNVQSKEIERRLMSFRRSKEYDAELKGKTVVLVDDGIATVATILSAVVDSSHSLEMAW